MLTYMLLLGFADADNSLQESLLAADVDSSAPVQPVRQPQQQQALILHRPFNVEDFIRYIVQSWLAFLSKLTHSFSAALTFLATRPRDSADAFFLQEA